LIKIVSIILQISILLKEGLEDYDLLETNNIFYCYLKIYKMMNNLIKTPDQIQNITDSCAYLTEMLYYLREHTKA
jgi:hypothetical protein